MGKFINLIGQKFGKLTVIERAENDSQGNAQWLRTQKGIDIVTAITTPSRTRSKRYDG